MAIMFVRHAMPVIDESKPPYEWRLSKEGRDATRRLAPALMDCGITQIVSSVEPKCVGTAEVLAESLDIAWKTAPDLHEHRRDAMDWHGETGWHDLLQQFFANPDDLVFGRETAHQALSRFASAVATVRAEFGTQSGSLCIVSHGTVMSLFAARQLGVDPYSIWRELRLPDYVEVTSAEIESTTS